MIKYCVINADDFGRSIERNNAIDAAFSQGLVKSASLIVNTPYVYEAVSLAFNGGYVSHLHCHFNLAEGELGGFGHLLSNFKTLDLRHCGWKDWKSVFAELEAQYAKFVELTDGLANNDHVDFHLWDNLRLPIAMAYGCFLRRHRIKTCRFIGTHHHYMGLKGIAKYVLL